MLNNKIFIYPQGSFYRATKINKENYNKKLFGAKTKAITLANHKGHMHR